MANEIEAVASDEVLEIMPVQEIKMQISAINDIMKRVMVEDVHYGKVPGCGDKPTLLKPGAEILSLSFRLDLQTVTETIEHAMGHKEYVSVTTAYSKATGKRLGNGQGCATTLESKWKYRSENTGGEVPKEYWKTRDAELIGGSHYSTKKITKNNKSTWFIMHKVEHDNPADYYNTCLKMSEKRSRVACALNVTGASHLFTQDVEDMDTVNGNNNDSDKPQNKRQENQKQKADDLATDKKGNGNGDSDGITPPQLRLINTCLNNLNIIVDDERHEEVSKILKLEVVIDSLNDLTKKQASKAIEVLKQLEKEGH